jgi:type IV pilus assembly protein PilB
MFDEVNAIINPMPIQFDDQKSQAKLDVLRQKEDEDLARILAEKYGIPYIDLSGITIDTDGLRLVEEERSRKSKAAVFDLTGKRLRLGMLTPNRPETNGLIKNLEERGFVVEPYVVSNQSLEKAWSRYEDISYATRAEAGSLKISNKEIEKYLDQLKTIDDIRELVDQTLKMKKAFRVSRIVEIILASAIAVESSDIHVEPREEDVRIRFRLDGVLSDIAIVDMETYRLLLSRIKLLSGMKLNIKEVSQDGRYTIKISDVTIEIRSSVIPGAYGESIVMRLLNPETLKTELSDLGIEPFLLDVFKEEVLKPNGLILNTGPTGSGKTTTLYAFMRIKYSPEIKIITIEDPIEYHLDGVVQTQVDKKKGYDFNTGLVSSLRQDPDVIMVGEIRDFDTAETAIQASLTGHLVFSTLHTNTAAGAFTRLIDLGVNPKVLTSAINIAIAQRLVRRLCPECRKVSNLDSKQLEKLKEIYDDIQNPTDPWHETFYEPGGGCEKCNGRGYKGRIALFEAVKSTPKVEEVLQMNPSEREVKEAARDQGIMDMAEDGVIKMLRGITSLEEVQRVVDLNKRQAHKTAPDKENNFQELSNEDLLNEDIDLPKI